MRRKLFTLAAAVSAVVCVGVCGLWVRSYQVDETLTWDRSYGAVRSRTDRSWVVDCQAGGLLAGASTYTISGPAVTVGPTDDGRVRFHRTPSGGYLYYPSAH